MEPNSFETPVIQTSLEPAGTVVAAKPRRSVVVAWLAILVTVVIAIWPRMHHEPADENDDSSIALQEIQAKLLVGATNLVPGSREVNREQIQTAFLHGPVRQQLIGVILLGELVNLDSALKSLEALEDRIQSGTRNASDTDRELVNLLNKNLRARSDPSDSEVALSEVDRQACEEQFPKDLGWAGELALFPVGTPDPSARARLLNDAHRMIFVGLGILGLGGTAACIGLVLQVLWWCLAFSGRLQSGIPELRGDSVIYAETFAVWMALFLALILLVHIPQLAKLGMVVVVIPQIGSLAALAWPVVRGLRWRDVREDIGLKLGRQSWTAPLVGVGAYVSALPLIFIAMIITVIMMQIASLFVGSDEAMGAPAHPIVEPILHGNWTVRLQLLFVAVFAAVPEEIMFRGVLYRHLREAGSRLGYIGSVTFATLISSFIFAIIHPQGLFGIPLLMTIAIVFAVVREWRGSLVPSMITHALVNSVTASILFLIAD